MSVGCLEVRRTEYETFEKQKIMPHDPGMLILSQKVIRLSEDPMELQFH